MLASSAPGPSEGRDALRAELRRHPRAGDPPGPRRGSSRDAATTSRLLSGDRGRLDKLPNIVLDGELVILDRGGKPQSDRVRRRVRLKNEISIRNAAHWEPRHPGFHILRLEARSAQAAAAQAPRDRAHGAASGDGSFKRIGWSSTSNGSRLYQAASGLGLEGVVAKRQTRLTAQGDPKTGSRSRDQRFDCKPISNPAACAVRLTFPRPRQLKSFRTVSRARAFPDSGL